MAQIPPHYSELFITERFNKALYIVQNLPKGSTFQPTNNEKLELYSLYKQVSEGDINIKRPGLFDVVGRAKWDAWKKLEGVTPLEAKHSYVEALLRITTEAYKKNIGKEQAQEIIHSFAIMKPSMNNDFEETTDDSTSNQEDDSSVAASDEEQEYLRDVLKSNSNKVISLKHPKTGPPNASPDRQTLQSRRTSYVSGRDNNRPSSIVSVQTMVTAPSTRPSSAAGSVGSVNSRMGQNKYRGNEKYPEQHMIKNDLNVLPNKDSFNEDFDDSVNPWQHTKMESGNLNTHQMISKNTGRITEQQEQFLQTNDLSERQASYLKSPSASPIPQQFNNKPTYVGRGHLYDPSSSNSTLSFVAATPQQYNMHIYNNSQNEENKHVHENISNNSASNSQMQSRYITIDPNSHGLPNSQQYNASIATLGPATKRALEVLHNEVIALNDRIDDLKRELVKERTIIKPNVESKDESSYDGWNWLTKVIIRYARNSPMTAALIVIFILYKSGRFWQKIKLSMSQ